MLKCLIREIERGEKFVLYVRLSEARMFITTTTTTTTIILILI